MSSGISASVVSKPGVGLAVSRCAKFVSPSGTLVSAIPIGNLPVPKITSTSCPKAASTLVLVTFTKTLDFSDSLNLTPLAYKPL